MTEMRRRSEYFSSEEVRVLHREFEARRKQVNNPAESLVAWLTIASHVSAVSGISRTVEQCKRKIENLKYKQTLPSISPGESVSSRQPQSHCLFCSQAVDLQYNFTLTEDLVRPLCQILQLKSTRYLNFEEQLLQHSLCPNCHGKTIEARLAHEELTRIQEKIQSISTTIETYIVIGVQRTDDAGISIHPDEETDSLRPTELRMNIVKALNLDLSTYVIDLDEALRAPPQISTVTGRSPDTLESDVDNLYGDDFQEIGSPNSSEVETTSNGVDMDQSNNYADDDAPTVGKVFIRTGIFDDSEDIEIPGEDVEILSTKENYSICKDPLESYLRAEDSTGVRCRKFTQKETKAFIVEYEKRKATLEGPGQPNSDTKLCLWTEIVIIVNSIEGASRSLIQYKKKLENLKNQTKGDISGYLQNLSHIDYDDSIGQNALQVATYSNQDNREETETPVNADFMDHSNSDSMDPVFRRNKNFTPKEVKALLVEYEKRKDVLGLKGLDAQSINTKFILWEEIALLVTSTEGIHRDVRQCKKKFEALKSYGVSEYLETLSHIDYDDNDSIKRDVEQVTTNSNDQTVDANYGEEDYTEFVFRNKNFSRKEIKALLVEYKKRSAILEGPESVNSTIKLNLWQEIVAILNSVEGEHRTLPQCKKKFANLNLKSCDISEYLKSFSDVEYKGNYVGVDPEEAEMIPVFDDNSSSDVGNFSELPRRNRNFSPEEVKGLLVEYEKRRESLECPGSPALATKFGLWEEIASIVTEIDGVHRDVQQCKKKLTSLKSYGVSEYLETLSHIEYDDSIARDVLQAMCEATDDPSLGAEDCTESDFSKRNKNFTGKEIKALLVEYVKRKDTLEGPDPPSSRAKIRGWTQIASIVSSMNGVNRNVQQCKKKVATIKSCGISECLQSLSHVKYEEPTVVNVQQVTTNYVEVDPEEAEIIPVYEDNSSFDVVNSSQSELPRRNRNFSPEEVKGLLVEYEKRKDSLECSGSPALAIKFGLWEEIASIVTEIDGVHRDVQQCKKKLTSLKSYGVSEYLQTLSHIEYDDSIARDVLQAMCEATDDSSLGAEDCTESDFSKRNKNFTDKEIKALLVEYVKRKDTLEGPGPPSSRAKIRGWTQIASIVSSMNGVNRNVQQCKKKFATIKTCGISECLQSLSYVKYEGAPVPNSKVATVKKVTIRNEALPEPHRMKTRDENFAPSEVRVLMAEYKKSKADIEKYSKDVTHWNKIASLVSAVRELPRTIVQCKKRVYKELCKPTVQCSDDEESNDSKDANSDKDDGDADYQPTEDETKTRKRRSNFNLVGVKSLTSAFSPEETATLISEYTKHKNFLETATRASPKRHQLWELISRLVSRTQGVRRTSEQCWKKIRNLEYQAIQKESLYRKFTEISRTGLVALKDLKLKLHRCDDPEYKKDMDLNINMKCFVRARINRNTAIHLRARARHLKNRFIGNTKAQKTKVVSEGKRRARREMTMAQIHRKSRRVNHIFKCTFPSCGLSFKQEDRRDAHYERVHKGNTFPFKCVYPDCKKAFRYPSHLETHAAIHTGKHPYQCDICQKSFINAKSLSGHKLIIHEKAATKFHCSICNRYFLSKHTMQKHIKRVHEKERPFLCELCSCAFPSKNELQSHQVRLHPDSAEVDTSKFKCDECGTIVCSSAYLKLHKLRHKNALPYPCTFPGCSFQADRPSNLKIHTVMHTGERKYKCTEDQCDKTFKRIAQLRKHLVRHAGTGIKICPHCDKKCADARSLKNHIDVLHFPELKKYFCESCGEGFPIRKYLDRHRLICAQGLTGTSKRHGTKRPVQDSDNTTN